MEETQTKQRSLLTPILIGLLVVASFFIGMLFTKLQILESSTGNDTVTGQKDKPAAKGADAAEEPPVAGKATPVTDSDYIQGDKNAQLVMVVYSDLECPYCQLFHKEMETVMKTYNGKVAWVYRHFPLPPTMHPNAHKAAEAADCVAELGGNTAFWKFVDSVYKKPESVVLNETSLENFAVQAGVNKQAYTQCLNSERYVQRVDDSLNEGRAAGVNGTPATFLFTKDGQVDFLNGYVKFPQIKAKIDQYVQ